MQICKTQILAIALLLCEFLGIFKVGVTLRVMTILKIPKSCEWIDKGEFQLYFKLQGEHNECRYGNTRYQTTRI